MSTTQRRRRVKLRPKLTTNMLLPSEKKLRLRAILALRTNRSTTPASSAMLGRAIPEKVQALDLFILPELQELSLSLQMRCQV